MRSHTSPVLRPPLEVLVLPPPLVLLWRVRWPALALALAAGLAGSCSCSCWRGLARMDRGRKLRVAPILPKSRAGELATAGDQIKTNKKQGGVAGGLALAPKYSTRNGLQE